MIALDIAAKPLEMQESMESCSTFVFDVDSDMLLRNFRGGNGSKSTSLSAWKKTPDRLSESATEIQLAS